MNNIQGYEKLIKKKVAGKLLMSKIAFITGYVLFAVIGILLTVIFAGGNPALLVLVAALDLCFVLVTWRLTQVEYEYAFMGGSFYLSKIFGKSARKDIFDCELSRAIKAAPFSGQYKKDAEREAPDKIYRAISAKDAADVWFIMFENETEQKTMVLIEADEGVLKCLRQGCPRAVAREKLSASQTKYEQ